MSISLVKGQKIDLTKGNSGLTGIMVGLGWDQADKQSGGVLKSLFNGKKEIDCDASVLMLNEAGKLEKKNDLVYYGNLRSKDSSVIHKGDNLTGGGDGDDEQIFIDLSKVESRIKKLVFVVNIYDCDKRNQDFGMIKNAYIRVVDANATKELLKFNLSNDYAGSKTLIAGEIYRDSSNEWKFGALGDGTRDNSLSTICKSYK